MALEILAALAGGVIQGGMALAGANKQVDAANRATNLNRRVYRTTRRDLEPYREAGTNALRAYSDVVTQPFEASDAYRFRLNEANDAIEASAAARGGLFSGATMQAIGRNSQNYASQEFDNYLRRLEGLSGMGQNASVQQGSFGQGFANAASQAAYGAGNAQSAGLVGAGNAINSGIQGALGAWQYGQQQQQNQQIINALRQ